MTKKEIIEGLALAPHPNEGGYYRRTYESDGNIMRANSERKLLTSIYYMLTNDSPCGFLHRNKSDIIHFHHCGSPIQFYIVTSEGIMKKPVLGSNIGLGELPQLTVKGGDWKASQLLSGEYGLISEVVAPGFDYDDNEMATLEIVQREFPQLTLHLDTLIQHGLD